MTNLSRFTGIFCCVFVFIFSVCCEDENYFKNRDLDDMIDPHSFSYNKHSKSMNDEMGISGRSKDYTREHDEDKKDCNCVKPVDNSENQAAIFYKRLINMMLLNMNIKQESDVLLVGTLEIIMTPTQMEILKNFHTQPASLREVDEILSMTIIKPSDNLYRLDSVADFLGEQFERFGMAFQTVLEHIGMAFWSVWKHPDVLPFLSVLLLIGLTLRMIRYGHGISMFILIQIIFVVSFLMTWWNLIQEAEIKAMAEQMKFSNIPISCQPDKMTIWDKFVSFLSANDDCEKYHQAMMSNPKLKVTPAHALSHLFSTVTLQPIIHMGTAVSGFITNATDDLPWLYGWLVKCLLFLCVGIVIIMLPIFLSGGFVDFGMGPLFKFAISFHKKQGQGNPLEYDSKREPVKIYLQTSSQVHGANAPNIMDVPVAADTPAITCTPVTTNEPAVEQLIKFDESEDEVERGIDKCDAENRDSRRRRKLSSELKKHDGSGDA
ncbi:uncharacterized protein LOC117225657 isoform X1 [Megalopta genalis]|uniref:uncharacterized protein LOC117225657 isoform X1 n=1 Tax=Megalopta genalis TaxID=115081 RepID=UPI003FD24E8A